MQIMAKKDFLIILFWKPDFFLHVATRPIIPRPQNKLNINILNIAMFLSESKISNSSLFINGACLVSSGVASLIIAMALDLAVK